MDWRTATSLEMMRDALVHKVIGVGEFALCSVFSDTGASGNQTIVFRLAKWPADDVLAKISLASGVHEATFVLKTNRAIEIRWFLGRREVPLCGHAALAVASLFAEELPENQLTDVQNLGGRLALLPNAISLARTSLKKVASDSIDIGLPITEAYSTQRDYLFVVPSWDQLSNFKADKRLQALDKVGCILTSQHPAHDAALRFFVPGENLFEDPASASALPAIMEHWGATESKMSFVQCSSDGTECLLNARAANGRCEVNGNVHWLGIGIMKKELYI